MNAQTKRIALIVLLVVALLLAGCNPVSTPTPAPAVVSSSGEVGLAELAAGRKIKVLGLFATQLSEPWDQAIHRPLAVLGDARIIDYRYVEALGYDGQMQKVARQVVEDWRPDLIIGDGFGNNEGENDIGKVAAENPGIVFVFGTDKPAKAPNFSIFDNENKDGAYIAGRILARASKSGVLGQVLGKDLGECNRLGNAFVRGVLDENPKGMVYSQYINDWYAPDKAYAVAEAMIKNGADGMYGERLGAERAAADAGSGVLVVGQMIDVTDQAPANTISCIIWNLEPMIRKVIGDVQQGKVYAENLGNLSWAKNGGTYLSPVPDNLATKYPWASGYIEELMDKIRAGELVIANVDTTLPAQSKR